MFIRVFDDINGLVHLSEISTKNYDNPAEALKLGQVVRAKIILMEPKYRKIGLSIKATFTDEQASTDDYSPEVKKAAPKKVVAEEVAE
ncbi:S1 RNA-binding domain-containing protein [Patescibacteria group bacterium]|nr:S1 RNA-binding domain-containing protein [Patescibacteria group bacterium]